MPALNLLLSLLLLLLLLVVVLHHPCVLGQVSIRHNNQTGRWVVPFRPCWSPSGSAVLVGDMKRGVCVFDAAAGSGGGKAGQQRSFLTAPELMTAIPSRMAAHGGLGGGPVVAAATSSGRVHIWRR